MQTPLNKRVIGRHVGQKRKGSRAEQSKVSAEWTGAASEEHREWNRLCNWSTQPVASIGYANDLPWQVAACLPQLPSLCHSSPAPLHAWSQQRATASLGHLLGGRATKIKTKQRFPIKATTWPPGNVATPPARATIQCDSIRFDSIRGSSRRNRTIRAP